MTITVCLCANSLGVPDLGGHRWVYLNWALGLRALGCRVIWLEGVNPNTPVQVVHANVTALKGQLERYAFAESVALYSETGEPLSGAVVEKCIPVEMVTEADLLLNIAYGSIPAEVVRRFRRSVLMDIDPGLTQIWISEGRLPVARHDVYFTIGETVGRPGAMFPDCGLEWHYTPPPVFLPEWPLTPADPIAPWTTVTSWWEGWLEFGKNSYPNRKRDGFLPFLDLPRRLAVPLEMAVSYDDGDKDLVMLQQRGWRVRNAQRVASTPWDYQRYVQSSRGEFSCVKPSCVRLQNAWISDRTLCYLASGKPVVVQNTGPSRLLPDAAGLFRFRDLDEAVLCLESAVADYDRHSTLARALADEYFDARKVAARVLERALV